MVMIDKQNLKIEFSKRLNEACEDLGWPEKPTKPTKLNPTGVKSRVQRLKEKLEPYFKISQPGIRKWFIGESVPDATNIGYVAIALNVRLEWLSTGKGVKNPEIYQPTLTQTSPKWLKSLTEKVENLNYTPTDNDIAAISGYLEVKANESRMECMIKMDKQKMADFQYAMQMVVTGPLADMKYTEEEIKQGLREIYLEDHPDETITPDDEEYISMLAKSAAS